MRFIPAAFAAIFVLTSCTGGQHFHVTSPAEAPSTPPYLDLHSDYSVGTLHFPAGIYVLEAEDDKGYYYKATRQVVQRSFSRGAQRDGGIFVEKRNSHRLRGYIIMPSGLTHVGNLSRADYELRY